MTKIYFGNFVKDLCTLKQIFNFEYYRIIHKKQILKNTHFVFEDSLIIAIL